MHPGGLGSRSEVIAVSEDPKTDATPDTQPGAGPDTPVSPDTGHEVALAERTRLSGLVASRLADQARRTAQAARARTLHSGTAQTNRLRGWLSRCVTIAGCGPRTRAVQRRARTNALSLRGGSVYLLKVAGLLSGLPRLHVMSAPGSVGKRGGKGFGSSWPGSGWGQTWSVGMIHSSPMAVWRGRVIM